MPKTRDRTLTKQIVVRVTSAQREWLQAISDEEGRTIAQSVRWLIQLVIDCGLPR